MSDFVNTVDLVGDEALTTSIIDKSITEIKDDGVRHIGTNAFYGCKALASVIFLAVTQIGNSAFNRCSALTRADFPAVTQIGNEVFYECTALTSVYLPAATKIGQYALYGCSALTRVDLPAATSFGTGAFQSSNALEALILRSGTRATAGSSMFSGSSKIASGTGYIYVPAALVNSYKTATNWSTYANQFRALEDYTVDGTTTGALDESKI